MLVVFLVSQRTKHQSISPFLNFVSSIGLTLLGHIPGIAYAWYVIYKNRDEPEHVRHYGRTYSAIPSHQHLPEGHYHVAPADQHVAGAHVHVDPAHTQ
ncbi:hypothetical protein B0O80DRAFT_459565 [Mortierella sp. GBAus27b]|nr:hypothetical protein B0O80DRAFT_459565 [Mortierella sp. GBAus27b]